MDPHISRNQVLLRYKLPVFYTNTAFSNTAEQNVAFINQLTKCFEDESTFRADEFSLIPMDLLLDYVRRTHILYLDKSLQEIEQSIILLNDAYPAGHPVLSVLNEFFLEYKSDLIHHIHLEDGFLIPYISFLNRSLSGKLDLYRFYAEKKLFNLRQFTQEHDDHDAELELVRLKLLTYEAPPTNKFLYGVLVNQLDFFRQDLKIHGLIEDEILIPRALEMEEKLDLIFKEKVRLN